MSEADAPVLLTAEFDPKTKTYWLVSSIAICAATIVLIPIIPIVLVVGLLVTGKYLDAMECEMTTRSLRVKKGIINTIEKTIPLDKITDLAHYQGPIMRAMGIEGLRVETAGQSSGTGGSLVTLVGVKDARAFRDSVLDRRDKVTDFGGSRAAEPVETPAAGNDSSAVLVEIRDALLRIEESLQERT
jgi:putative membrane protein